MKLLDQFGNQSEQERTRYVIITDDGKHVLQDPTQEGANGKGIYYSYNKDEAERQKLICRKDFGQNVHVVDLATAVVTLSKNRYDIEFKRPITWPNIKRQLEDMIKKGTLK